MMAEYGFVDTMKSVGPGWYEVRDAAAYFNAYAAMPSLHFAWSMVFGWLFFTQGGRLLKLAGVLYPAITLAAIIVTANHYLLDAAAGALLMALAFCTHHAIRKAGALSRGRLSVIRGKMRLPPLMKKREVVKSGG